MTGSPPCNPERRPLFSIVIPTFNQERYLERAIQSILCQADDDTECLVVDGGSTDGSHAILQRYRHRLSWWCSEPDKGQSDALNKGFALARGEFLTWLNADDLLLSGTLAALRRAIKMHPNVQWFVGNQIYIDENDRVVRCARDGRWHNFLFRFAPVLVYGPSAFFHRDLYAAACRPQGEGVVLGGLDVSLKYAMDIDLWLRFKQLGAAFLRVNHYFWGFRRHAGSKTTRTRHCGREQNEHRREFRQICASHGQLIAWHGRLLQRAWRFVNGCYGRAAIDTLRWRGRDVRTISQRVVE